MIESLVLRWGGGYLFGSLNTGLYLYVNLRKMIKGCLECKKDYKAKRDTSKFCSDNCRVKWNQKNKQTKSKKKENDLFLQMQVMMNTMIEKMGKTAEQLTVVNPNFHTHTFKEQPKKAVLIRSAEAWHDLKRECVSADEWSELKEQIENAENLSTKQKQIIINTPFF